MKLRLDQALTKTGLVTTRSQAESWIKLGKVTVDGVTVRKPGFFVADSAKIALLATERYVSRAGLKLASVASVFNLDFKDKIVLDVGSSTGGFTDYALQHGARQVVAVDVGTEQMHPSLRADPRVDLHEKTDIRSVWLSPDSIDGVVLRSAPDIVVIDVSFISLREVLPHICKLSLPKTAVVAMVKPQFEAGRGQLGGSGVVKNDTVRRAILHDFELWVKAYFTVVAKADSAVAGANGNRERFYFLCKNNVK